MARVIVQYDAATGSDSYSGSGGTPVTGANADISGSTITLNETKDLSAFAPGDVIYYAGNAGDRHLFEISAFNPSAAACTSITTVESATAARTGSLWGVGGKRQTLQADTSRRDHEDADALWTFELAAGTYNMGASMTVPSKSGSAIFKIQGAGRDSTTIMLTANTYLVNGGTGHVWFDQLEIDTNASPSTGTYVFRCAAADTGMLLTKCRVQNLQGGMYTYFAGLFSAVDTEFKDLGASATVYGTYGPHVLFYGCEIHGCGSHGIELGVNGTSHQRNVIVNCLIHNNGGAGIYVGNSAPAGLYANNTIHDNAGDGIEVNLHTAGYPFVCVNNLITSNGGYGIEGASASPDAAKYVDNNAFGWTGDANTNGETLNGMSGSNDVTLTANPYTNEASLNFTPNDTSGGGLSLKAAGVPSAFPAGTTTGYTDIGAAQRQEPTAGGGLITHPGMSGGMRG